MQKRGQVTIFLVVGIVILMISAALFVLSAKVQKKELFAQQHSPLALAQGAQVEAYIERCIEQTAQLGIQVLAWHGGVIEQQKASFFTEYDFLNKISSGQPRFSTALMEEELAGYVDETMSVCIADFEPFTDKGLEIEHDEIDSKAILSSSALVIESRYPVRITTLNETIHLDTFTVALDSPFTSLLKQGQELADMQLHAKQIVDLASLPHNTVLEPFDEDTMIYSLLQEPGADTGAAQKQAPLVFRFAIQIPEQNKPPRLEYIPNLVLSRGEKFAYQLDADDEDAIRFSSDSAEFPVSEVGDIEVIPQQAGTYFVTFMVEDSTGQKDEQKVRIVVE